MAQGGGEGVLSVGRSYCDVIFTGLARAPSPGTEIFAEGLSLRAGGGAPITAAHLAALGRPSLLATVLPAAPFREAVALPLADAGVDLRFAADAPKGADPQVTVALSDAQDRSFVTRRSGRAAPQLRAADLAGLGVGHLHIGELATLVEMPGLLTLARQAGLTVSLDCSWDEALNLEEAASLIAAVDVFLPNEAEAAALARAGIPAPFSRLTVTKQGPRGAAAQVAERPCIAVPAPPAEVVDTTGAGDAFNAGFIDAWLRGAPIEAALDAGVARGALAVTHVGGFTTPDLPLQAPALSAR